MTARILIINTNRELSPQPAVPVGAAWVAEALHQAGFNVKLLDLCFAPDPLKAIERMLAVFYPEGIGLSVRNLDNCDFLAPRSYLPELKEVAALLKSRSGARILVGGAGASIMPRQLLDYLDLDHAVVGEGERAAVTFFGGGREKEIAGLVSRGNLRDGNRPATVVPQGKPAAVTASCGTIDIMPRLHRWIDTRRYLKLEPVLPVQGKRGCAKGCLYCTYGRIEGENWRLRDPSRVVEEIERSIRDTGAREFEFVDSVFNEPEGYLEGVLEEVLRKRVKAHFRVSSLSPKGLTAKQLALMERSGVKSLVVTPESACDRTLASLGKDFGEDEVRRAAELFARSRMRALWCFLVGAPDEDETSLTKTVSFINGAIGKKDAAFVTMGIRVYPDTPLHRVAVAEGVIPASHDLLMPSFYFSGKLTTGRARECFQAGVNDLSRCIFVSDTGSRTVTGLRRLGTMMKLPGPFWRYARYLNRINGKGRVIYRG
ncbi:B12-binding domain-containing radical SAM protein [Geomonas sp. Red276]